MQGFGTMRHVLPDYLLPATTYQLLPHFRSHLVSFRFMGDFGQAEGFHQGRDVHAETAAESFFETVPTAGRIGFGAAPGFDGSVFGGFLFVGTAEFHPVAMVGEHFVEIVEAVDVVVQNRFSDRADQNILSVFLVHVHGVFAGQRWRFQGQWFFFGSDLVFHSVSGFQVEFRTNVGNLRTIQNFVSEGLWVMS